MKNIKVNVRNQDGKPSSTTLNYSICEWLYLKTYSDEERIAYQSYDHIEMRKAISQNAQTFTNELVATVDNYDKEGITQYRIESAMMIAMLYGRN